MKPTCLWPILFLVSLAKLQGAVDYATFGRDASVIAVWATPDHAVLKDKARVGVVAYHQNGLTGVRFTVNGEEYQRVREQTINPDTGEIEYVCEIDISQYAPGAVITVGASVHPLYEGATPLGVPVELEPREFIVHDPTWKTYYLDANLGDDANPGTADAPFKSPLKALATVKGGDTILVRNGDYHLALDPSQGYETYVTLKAEERHQPRVTSVNDNVRCGFLRFDGLVFDWTGNPRREMFKSYSTEGHLWFVNCTFTDEPDRFDRYTMCIKVYGAFRHLVVEDCTFEHINVAIAGPPYHTILRGNTVKNITSDAFDVFSGSLVSGNYVTGIQAPRLYVTGLAQGPFNLKDKNLTVVHKETRSYVSIPVDFAAYASSLSAVTPQQAAEAMNVAFQAKKETFGLRAEVVDGGAIKITSLRSNYRQHLYFEGDAAEVFGFGHLGKENELSGSGQHADVFQYWAIKGEEYIEDMVIRNNIAHSNVAQGWLPQAKSRNIAFFNNLIDYWYEGGWVVLFEKSYENICLEFNTIWGSGTTVIFKPDVPERCNNFVKRNNVEGVGVGAGDFIDNPRFFAGYNVYDFNRGGKYQIAETSRLVNPGKTSPTPSGLFANLKVMDASATDADVKGYDYYHPEGDFTPAAGSVLVDAGLKRSNVTYDINWKPRGDRPDIGAFER